MVWLVLLASIDSLSRRPTGDDHFLIFDAWVAVSPIGERMFQEPLVVTLGVISALVGTARLGARQSAVSHRLRHV